MIPGAIRFGQNGVSDKKNFNFTTVKFKEITCKPRFNLGQAIREGTLRKRRSCSGGWIDLEVIAITMKLK